MLFSVLLYVSLCSCGGGTGQLQPQPSIRPSTSVQAENSGVIDVKQFGAKGDGITDDADALAAAVSHVNSLHDKPVTLLFPPGRYFINPRKGMRSSYGLYLTASNVTILGDNASLELLPGSVKYNVVFQVPPKATRYWNYLGVRGSNVTVRSMAFNSNGMTSVGDYSPHDRQGKFWATALQFNSDSSAPQTGNSAIENRFINIGGWAVFGEHQANFTISRNYATFSEGMGCSAWTDHCVISDNVSENALDAHFFANGWTAPGSEVHDIQITGNTATGNSNGNGIDVTAATDGVVEGNLVSNNQGFCILVGKTSGPYAQPDAWLPSQRITVTGNTCKGNGLYQGWPINAEIFVGEQRPGNGSLHYAPGDVASDIVIGNNEIVPQHPQQRGIAVGYGVARTTVSTNLFRGCGQPDSHPCVFPFQMLVRIEDWGSSYLTVSANYQDLAVPVGYIYLGTVGPYNVSGNNLIVETHGRN